MTLHPFTFFAVFIAFVVKGLCGFANTLVFSSIMSFSSNNVNISPVDLITGLPANLYMAWRERHGVRARIFVPLALLVLAGCIPGALLLRGGDAGSIKALFGAVVIFIGVESLLRARVKEPKPSSPVLLAFIGILSGALCGLFGIGALLVAYVSRTTSNQEQFRGNLCAVFMVENVFRFILYAVTGILTPDVLRTGALLIPAMAIGLGMGMLLARRISEKNVARFVNIMLILMGVTLLAGSLGR